jgi:hypothetical protein
MYVHQHWPYLHPYAARTWTVEDWRGYADGLKKLGYNAVMIWPVIEVMPEPLLPSDREHLERTQQVIGLLHREFGMRAWIALCPNVAANDSEAAKAPFEMRHFFYSDIRVNPRDPAAVERMLRRRERLFQYLRDADAVSIIDSDPGGYPASTNADFIHLLVEHRKMLDRVRKGIELVYWMHAGWEAYGRYYQTGEFAMAGDAERLDMLRRLTRANLEPWGLANGYPQAETLGIARRVVSFNYGRIEGEPSFPMTNFGGMNAWEGGRLPGPRGEMGNAQTHCVQLPNTYAFARGATGGPAPTLADYVAFAERLIPGKGEVIVRGWRALSAQDATAMRAAARDLESATAAPLATGDLKGLLFGDPKRFLVDLVYMLRLRAAYLDFLAAQQHEGNWKAPMRAFVAAAAAWQQRHGYQNHWGWPGMEESLRKLHSSEIDAVLDDLHKPPGLSGFESVREHYYRIETFTPRLLEAMRQFAR